MELLAEPVIVTSKGNVLHLGKEQEMSALGVTKRSCYVSTVPLLYAVSVPALLPLADVLQNSHSFVVHWPKNDALVAQAASVEHQRGISLGITPAETVESPRLAECNAYMECEVLQRIPCGDHLLVIGQVRKREW